MERDMKRKKAFFSISAVAKMFSVHQQTIRLYEKQGLITPKRSEGNTRLFSEEDVNRLEEVIYLTHQLGINIAGVEMILKLKKQIATLKKDMNKVFENAQDQLTKEEEISKKNIADSAKQLMKLKEHTLKEITTSKDSGKIVDVDDWDIEYDE